MKSTEMDDEPGERVADILNTEHRNIFSLTTEVRSTGRGGCNLDDSTPVGPEISEPRVLWFSLSATRSCKKGVVPPCSSAPPISI